MKKLISLFAIGFLFLGSASFAASSPDEQWRMQRGDYRTAHKSIQINDGMIPLETYSYLWAERGSGNKFSRYVCANTIDQNCSNPDVYTYQALLPKCEDTSDIDCIEGLNAYDSAGKVFSATFKRYNLDSHPNNFVSTIDLGITHNSNPSIWDIPEAPHVGGTSYVIVAGANANKFPTDPSSPDQVVFAYVMPVSVRSNAILDIAKCRQSDPSQNYMFAANTRCTGSDFEYVSSSEVRCATAYGSAGQCLTPEKFPSGFTYELKLRLKKEPLGWFHGRITDPQVSITKPSSGGVSISVKAKPVQVPIFLSAGLWSELGEKTKSWWVKDFVNCMENCGPAGGSNPDDPTREVPTSFIELSQYPYGEFAMEIIKKLASEVGDKSIASPSVWSFKTLRTSNSAALNPCISSGSGLKGIVTTNSTTYSQGAPTFKDGELSYKVASLHTLSDGSVFKGTYDLLLKSEVARCLYNFSKAPISASIEVINEAGVNQVATTTVNEKDGWLYLSANNFTFSSPTVKVKLTQEVEKIDPVATPTPTPSSKPAVAKKITIACVKGKTSKKVTAVKPVCPSGFKKK